MNTKSVIAGEYTAPPAHGPRIAEICGTTPEAIVLRRKMSAYPARETTPSWMRAPPGVVEADDRDAELEGEVHDLADLLGVGLRERTAEDREVLREHRGLPPVDAPEPGDHAVARDALALHPEVVAAVSDEAIDLVEAAGVEQEIESLACRELAGRVLLVDPFLAAPVEARRLQVLQTLADVVAHVSPPNVVRRCRKADYAITTVL